jgi:hypothetical protein
MTELFGENLIDSYTRADMVEDGSLVDVTSTARKVGFLLPVALTYAVWVGSIQPYDGPGKPTKVRKSGALWDCLMMLYIGLKHTKSQDLEFLFPVIIIDESGSDEIVILKAVLGQGDEGEPVITIMERQEE